MTDKTEKLLGVFRRALRCELPGRDFSPDDLEQWDSLTHIKLIMELEMAYGISIGPDDIPDLYSSFQAVAAYIERSAPGG